MVQIELVKEDVVSVEADILLLKHAGGFHGADESVHLRLVRGNACREGEVRLDDGESSLIDTRGAIVAKRVLFLGTPSLWSFRYKEIREFARRAIARIAESHGSIEVLATTVHGAGYGLDIEESFKAMILGFQQGLATHPLHSLKKVVFVEKHTRRHDMLRLLADDASLVVPPATPTTRPAMAIESLVPSAPKKSVFVAMPFLENYEDVYQFGIYGPIRKLGYVCEKVDESVFAGSIIDRIMTGIQEAEFVVADLSEARPNVYLEVGYALGLSKPVLLVAREGHPLHFDLSHHKCLFYPTIGKLADQLEQTIRDMFLRGRSP